MSDTCRCEASAAGTARQVSDKPQGRKPRAGYAGCWGHALLWGFNHRAMVSRRRFGIPEMDILAICVVQGRLWQASDGPAGDTCWRMEVIGSEAVTGEPLPAWV